MALKLGELSIDIEADSSGLKRAEKEVDRSANNMTTSLKRTDSAATKLFKVTMGSISVAAIAAYTKQMMSALDATAKFADRIGVGVEELQKLQFVAEQTGASVETMNMGLQRMTRRVAEAASGTGEAVKALEELNLNAEELTRLSPDEQFMAIADAMNDVTNQSDKVRLAFKLFDSEGVALINTMKGGSEAIMEIAEASVVATEQSVRQFEWFNDRMNEISKSTRGFWADMTGGMIFSWRKFMGELDRESVDREIENITAEIERLEIAFEMAAESGSRSGRGIRNTINGLKADLSELRKIRDEMGDVDVVVSSGSPVGEVEQNIPEFTTNIYELAAAYGEYGDAMREANATAKETATTTQTMDQAYSAMALSLSNLSDSFGGTETAAGKAVSALSNTARTIVAISQAQAAAMALADPTAITTPQKLLNYATIISSFATITGMLTQGGRQFGGSVSPMMATPVNEAGVPEMLSMGGKQYLLPTGQGGTVTPLSDGGAGQGGSSMVVNQNITVTGTGDKDLIMAMERAANQGAQKAQSEYVRQMSQKNGNMYKATQQNYGSGKTTGRAQ